MNQKTLCTSAIALGCAMAAPVSASEWDLKFGGYIHSHLAYVETSGLASFGTDFDGVSQLSTGEIHFIPSITLDNGLKIGANIQLEGFNNVGRDENNIDEAFAFMKGSFGEVLIGGGNSAGYLLTLGEEPDLSGNLINSHEINAFVPVDWAVPFNERQAGITSKTEVAGNDDTSRITYITPRFAGFQIGASYARNDLGNADQGFVTGGASNDNNNAGVKDIFDIGANYVNSFGGFNVAASARWGIGDAVTPGVSNPKTFAVGLDLGFAGVTIGGSFAEQNNSNGAFGVDQHGWGAGITYDAGPVGSLPWAFGISTYMGTFENTGGAGIDSHYNAYRIGANRDLGPGVNLDIYAIRVETDRDGTNAFNTNGTIIGTALKFQL